MEIIPWRAGLRFVSTMPGAQSAALISVPKMLKSSVGSWESFQMVKCIYCLPYVVVILRTIAIALSHYPPVVKSSI